MYFTLLFLFWHSKHFFTESLGVILKKNKKKTSECNINISECWRTEFFTDAMNILAQNYSLLTPSDKPKWTKEIAKLEARLAFLHSILWQTSIFSHVLSIFTVDSMVLGTFPCIISCNLYNSYLLFWHQRLGVNLVMGLCR